MEYHRRRPMTVRPDEGLDEPLWPWAIVFGLGAVLIWLVAAIGRMWGV